MFKKFEFLDLHVAVARSALGSKVVGAVCAPRLPRAAWEAVPELEQGPRRWEVVVVCVEQKRVDQEKEFILRVARPIRRGLP